MDINKVSTILHRFKIPSLLSVLLITVLLIGSCKKKLDFSYQVQDRKYLMFDEMKKDTSMSILVEALERTKLSGVLNSYGPYTLFAPNNEAFRKYFKLKGKAGLADFSDSVLTGILRYHILPVRLKAGEFIQGPQLTPSSSGDNVNIDISKGYKNTAVANAIALIYETDIEYYNGYMHKMDGVLDPPVLTIGEFLKGNPDKYSIITAGLTKAGLMDTLTNLVDNLGVRIKLTLFAETDDVLKAAGVLNYNGYTQDSLVAYMRSHIIPGNGVRSGYTHFTAKWTQLGLIERYDSAVSVLDGQNWIYFDLAAPHLIDSTSDFTASDLSMRNGLVHNVNKPLVYTGKTKKRTQIYHPFWSNATYCYGIPGFANGASPTPNASAGNFRYYFDGITVNGSQVTYLTFVQPDGIDDSLVTVVKNVKRGKYQIEVCGKGGGRGTFQLNYRNDSITTYNFSFLNLPTYRQRYVLGTYDFKTSGDKRLNFITKVVGGLNLECLVLTPVD
ncbi:fasciclin domain-containing protein [Ferruginibacter sp.]